MSSFYDLASLIMIPSGKKAGKVYSQKPLSTNGQLDFTRASTATRIGSDGLIEKTRTNLLLQSNSFDTTWFNSNSTETSGQSGYDGSNDAWRIDITGAAGYISQAIVNSGVKTASVYVKQGTLSFVRFRISGGGDLRVDVNLTNGNVGSIGTNNIKAQTVNVGNGWYRITLTSNTTISAVLIYPIVADSDFTATSGNIFIQDAQLESGLVATNVITTTTAAVSVGSVDNMPRLNYTFNSATSCPSLLLEPQRTNLILNSEYYGTFTTSNVTLTNNYATSPEGVQNATRWSSPGGSAYPQAFKTVTGLTIGQEYTTSFFTKSDGTTQIQQRVHFTGLTFLRFTPSNEWTRQEFQFTATSTSHTLVFFTDSASAPASSYLIYGIQVEAGSYATSYIPTFGATVTRVADACNKASVSSLIGQEQGTFFVEWESIGDMSAPYLALSAGGSQSNRVLIYIASGAVNSQIKSGSSIVFQSTAASVTGTIKAAVAYKTNDFVFYVNGSQYGTDSSGATFSGTTLSEIEFDHANRVGASVKKSVVFKTRLSNTQLADLTSIDS